MCPTLTKTLWKFPDECKKLPLPFGSLKPSVCDMNV